MALSAEMILESTSDAVTVLDSNWAYAYVNHSAELLLRRRRTELLGQSHWTVFPELRNTPAEKQLRRAADLRIEVGFEQFLPGLYAWHSVRAIPIDNGLMLFSRDISDRVRALRDESVRAGIRNILERAPVLISITRGKEHRIEMHNELARQQLGGRNLEGTALRKVLPELGGQGFFELMDKVYASGETFVGKSMRGKYYLKGMPELIEAYFDITLQPLFETNGDVWGIMLMMVDVTSRIQEQQLLARYAAERDATLQQLLEGVIITDAQGHITFINEAASRLHGVAILQVTPEQYSTTYHLFTVDGQPFPSEELPLSRAVVDEEVITNARWCIRRPDGSEVLVEGNAQPIYDDQGKKIAAVLTVREIDRDR